MRRATVLIAAALATTATPAAVSAAQAAQVRPGQARVETVTCEHLYPAEHHTLRGTHCSGRPSRPGSAPSGPPPPKTWRTWICANGKILHHRLLAHACHREGH
ncbi:hypothetical protein [Actinomadura opuntiae]|uniref:hypothetical protein n=1 Tax=Actinomadura sp. OS1-43 TaxID=604315 RepID=UPI00255AFAAB|nr:hypothetical protein [Actinomadura sp. OS1-43]MDL4813111.1 hypothetical protein [Actinomadura sp. OS1-43]